MVTAMDTTDNTYGDYRNSALFVECQMFYQVFFRTLGKKAICRVSSKKSSVKENTRQRSSLPSVLFLALGKEFLCPVFF
jgi:hypothetical protein